MCFACKDLRSLNFFRTKSPKTRKITAKEL